MHLEVAISKEQINCARRIYDRIPQMKLVDAALKKLRENMPGFSPEESLLKAVAINSLYGTQILAIVKMGRHVADIFKNPHKPEGVHLVESIAKLPGNKRDFISFASKFCHFFVDKENYPLYDEATRKTMKLHLGNINYSTNGQHPYEAFHEKFNLLRNSAGLKCETRDLDHYLWVRGMYMRYKEKNPRISEDLRQVFEKLTKNERDALLLSSPNRAFKGEI